MLTNTKAFLEVREEFNKTGQYTKALQGTYQYNEFWKEELRKCLDGVTIGNVTIPGTYYFYLNYTQMEMKNESTGRKTRNFPRFTDVDLEFFSLIEKARQEKKGFIMVKPRRTGFSYKNAALVTHEYNFFRDSRSIISAYENKYSDNTMNMTLSNLNFLDKNTVWYKPKNPNTQDFVKARHLKKMDDGREIWVGYNSEVKKITFKDNPFASAGLSASLFLFEEAGIFNNIIESYNISEPCWKDGDDMVGMPVIYGTGGDMSGGTAAFSEMYYDPERFNLLAFPNLWETDKSNQRCGWFLPATKQRFGIFTDPETKTTVQLVDSEGNSNEEYALKSILRQREIKKGNPAAYRDVVTQYPLTPSEAFLITSGNMFPTMLLNERLAELKSNPKKYVEVNWIGNFTITEDGELKFQALDNVQPLRNYPIKNTPDDSIVGCIEIYEQPQKDNDGKVFPRRYIVGIDTFDDDQSTTDSVGCAFVYDRLTKRIVAEYTGRPQLAKDFYENCRKLIMYYNAVGFPEINKLGFVTYMEHKKSLFMLAETPVQLRDRIEWKPNLNTSYGFKATDRTNTWGRELIRNWLLDPIENGSEILNVHRLRSTGLVQELIKWNKDGNFDRVSSLIAVLILDETLNKESIKKMESKTKSFLESDFFKDRGFLRSSNNPYGDDQIVENDYINNRLSNLINISK
jgi:tRNA splicing endonuclease